MARYLFPILLGLSFGAAPLAALAESDSESLHSIARSGNQQAAQEEAKPTAAEPEVSESEKPNRSRRAARGSDEAPPAIRALIARHAANHGVPAALAEAVARIESRFNPRASHAGNFGLMQIRLQTARGEGYSGSAQGLLDAETNANFGIKHLARAYRMANGDTCGTIMRYQGGLRTTRLSAAARAYCARAKAMMVAFKTADAR